MGALVAVAMTGPGCDSGSSDERLPSELIVGDWRVTTVEELGGDVSSLIGTVFESIIASFSEAGRLDLRVSFLGGIPDEPVQGTYTVNETTHSLDLFADFPNRPEFPVENLHFSFEFKGSDQLALAASPETAELISGLYGIGLRSPLSLELRRD